MKHIPFYFDVISFYACLEFKGLSVALMGQRYSVSYTSVLAAGLRRPGSQADQGPAQVI